MPWRIAAAQQSGMTLEEDMLAFPLSQLKDISKMWWRKDEVKTWKVVL